MTRGARSPVGGLLLSSPGVAWSEEATGEELGQKRVGAGGGGGGLADGPAAPCSSSFDVARVPLI